MLNDPLDETYLSPPEDWCADGELPEEEIEVRQALVSMYVLTNRLINFSYWNASSEPAKTPQPEV